MSDISDVVGDDGSESTRSSEPGLVGRGEREEDISSFGGGEGGGEKRREEGGGRVEGGGFWWGGGDGTRTMREIVGGETLCLGCR